MISTNEGYTRLEYFSEDVAADKNRKEFDIKNHTLCYTNQRPDFLFIGDSITEYWELNAYFRNSDQLIINRGIAGDTTKYLKKRFYVDAVQLKPKYCILGIVLPLVMPGIVATAIYTFINAWNEFLYSLILINSTDKMTVSVALKSLQGAEILNWGDMMAASALVVVPSVIFFMFIQNKIAGGMTEGAVK